MGVSSLRVEGLTYREAAVADCPAVAGVHVRSWRESFAGIVPQAFLDRMSVEQRTMAFAGRFSDPAYKMFVAEDALVGIVGFADCGGPRDEVPGYDAELYAIYLLPEFQGKGVGRELFRRVVDALVGDGKRSLYLMALEVSPYRSFYEKLGGRVIGSVEKEIEGIMFNVLVYGWGRID
jgi:GNAT superfamily N-acetyltransferase